MRIVMIFTIAFFAASCATNPQPQTASGSPEVTIAGAKPEHVKPILLNTVLNRRLRIKSDSPFLLVVEKETDNLVADIFLSSKYDNRVIERTSFTIAEVPAGTRIVADATFITNAGSAFERS